MEGQTSKQQQPFKLPKPGKAYNPKHKEAETIQSLVTDGCIGFSSYNTRSVEDIVSVTKPTFYNSDNNKLVVLAKYAKNVKSYIDDHSLYHKEHFDLILQMESLEELRLRNVIDMDAAQTIDHLSSLKNLKSLYLEDSHMVFNQLNYLVQTFPNLESLSINLTSITFPKSILSLLSIMKNLKELVLDDSRKIEPWLIESVVKNAPQLSKLTFQSSYFEDMEMWKNLEKLSMLTHLDLTVHTYQNQHKLMNYLPTIPTLKSFKSYLLCKHMSKQKLSILADKFPKLEQFHFRQVYGIDDSFVMKVVELWKDLKVVDFSSDKKDRKITIAGIQALIENSPNIQVLNLGQCFQIKDKSVSVICRLKNLKELKLNNCKLTTRCMIYLGKLKKLEVLNLSSNKIDFRVVVRFLKSLKLFEFSLWSNSRCEDKEIKENFNQLTLIKSVL